MVAPQNLDFSQAGVNPGEALAWTRSVIAQAREIGDYGTGRGETFEKGHANDAYVFDGLSGAQLAAGITETVEAGWSNDGYQHGSFDGAELEAGSYSVGATNLDLGRSAESVDPSATAAVFYLASVPTEELIATYGEPPPVGVGVQLKTTDTLPVPGDGVTAYFVVESDSVTKKFKVSLVPGGAPITWTTTGSGRHTTVTDDGWVSGLSEYRNAGLAAGDAAAGTYDAIGAQAGDGWVPGLTSSYQATFGGGDVATGQYQIGSSQSGAEAVGGVWGATFAFGGGATLLSAGHNLANGDAVLASSTGTLPAGLAEKTTYWVVNVVGGVSFQLSATHGGAAITPTDAGTGVHSVAGDPKYSWGQPLG